MKYITKYEKYKPEKLYWLLPTDIRYWKSIKEIGCPLEYAKSVKNGLNDEYVYISYNYSTTYMDGYGWMPFENSIKSDFYEDDNYLFKGAVNLNKEEIDKILMMEDLKKYNI
jgi:hypothetical protein